MIALWVRALVCLSQLIVGRWMHRQLARDFGSEYTSYIGRTPKRLPRRGERERSLKGRSGGPFLGG